MDEQPKGQSKTVTTPASDQRVKVLLIRLSSFGDLMQCRWAADKLQSLWPEAEISWVTRSDFASFLTESLKKSSQGFSQRLPNTSAIKVIAFDRKQGLRGWFKLSWQLRQERFTHVYDAHNNLRSQLLLWILSCTRLSHRPKVLRRSKNRLRRALLFWARINHFTYPFQGARSFIEPLVAWGVTEQVPQTTRFPQPQKVETAQKSLVFAPSAAWELKRWPLAHWRKLLDLILEDQRFDKFTLHIIGGAADSFIGEIVRAPHPRVVRHLGTLSWNQTEDLMRKSAGVVSADTGALHLADYWSVPSIALIGPTAFGYPFGTTSKILDLRLLCQPCSKDGRGQCRNPVYQACLKGISPEVVHSTLRGMIDGSEGLSTP